MVSGLPIPINPTAMGNGGAEPLKVSYACPRGVSSGYAGSSLGE
jgi:hypothetical protein